MALVFILPLLNTDVKNTIVNDNDNIDTEKGS